MSMETPPTATARAPERRQHKPRSGKARVAPALSENPVLDQLARLYPHLFGAVFRPLKRGIFQDLMAAHADAFESEALKAALALHTRSTRYLAAVAEGQARIDLAGNAVEAIAPQHVFYALLEVFRRRQNRSAEDLQPKLLQRVLEVMQSSGLEPKVYCELVRGQNPAAHAVLDQALAELATQSARDEALVRAFEAQTKPLAEFANDYGLSESRVEQALQRLRPPADAAGTNGSTTVGGGEAGLA